MNLFKIFMLASIVFGAVGCESKEEKARKAMMEEAKHLLSDIRERTPYKKITKLPDLQGPTSNKPLQN